MTSRSQKPFYQRFFCRCMESRWYIMGPGVIRLAYFSWCLRIFPSAFPNQPPGFQETNWFIAKPKATLQDRNRCSIRGFGQKATGWTRQRRYGFCPGTWHSLFQRTYHVPQIVFWGLLDTFARFGYAETNFFFHPIQSDFRIFIELPDKRFHDGRFMCT